MVIIILWEQTRAPNVARNRDHRSGSLAPPAPRGSENFPPQRGQGQTGAGQRSPPPSCVCVLGVEGYCIPARVSACETLKHGHIACSRVCDCAHRYECAHTHGSVHVHVPVLGHPPLRHLRAPFPPHLSRDREKRLSHVESQQSMGFATPESSPVWSEGTGQGLAPPKEELPSFRVAQRWPGLLPGEGSVPS